jgi:flagellar biosynthesis protein FliP
MRFKTFQLAAVLAAAIVLAKAPQACAQNASTTQPTTMAVPEISDVMKAVDKATAPGKDGRADWSSPVKLAVVFGALAILPSLLVMMTSFTRIIIVLSFIRRALTTQSIPPTVALIGLALFLTLFTMAPTFGKINQQALMPYLQDKITFESACSHSNNLLKEFMVHQTRPGDLELFVNLANLSKPKTVNDLPSFVAIPAFAVSEFRKSFEMGCLLFIPFLLIDLVISGILLAAGMMMLPPAMISLPFKIILFVLVDGWRLLAQTLVGSFNY